jgi:hypothetical protein
MENWKDGKMEVPIWISNTRNVNVGGRKEPRKNRPNL